MTWPQDQDPEPVSPGLAEKMNSLTDEEWAELTARMTRNFKRELDKRGMEIVYKVPYPSRFAYRTEETE